MARATTPSPTRWPSWGAAIGASAASQSFNRRVTLPAAAAGGICSQPRRHPSINSLPAVHLSVVSRSRGWAKRACSCSPTTHPGSFRCALHRGESPVPVSSRLHDVRRSARANSLVRTGSVEGGDRVRRALAALARPSSHHQRRRASFRALAY
nr:uncharacterized protein LOC109760535 [Aegilops tauschii subsp. strangulata]